MPTQQMLPSESISMSPMRNTRKRLVIGAVAAAVICVGVYVLSQPRKGSVEYHKRKYLQAGVPDWTRKNGIPAGVRRFYLRRFGRELEFHRGALIDAGYLKERVLLVSNCSPFKVVQAAEIELSENIAEFTSIAWDTPDTNAISVIAPAEWIEKIAHAIRKADLPETK